MRGHLNTCHQSVPFLPPNIAMLVNKVSLYILVLIHFLIATEVTKLSWSLFTVHVLSDVLWISLACAVLCTHVQRPGFFMGLVNPVAIRKHKMLLHAAGSRVAQIEVMILLVGVHAVCLLVTKVSLKAYNVSACYLKLHKWENTCIWMLVTKVYTCLLVSHYRSPYMLVNKVSPKNKVATYSPRPGSAF